MDEVNPASLYPKSGGAWPRVRSFFFSPESAEWLTILRAGLGLQVVAYLVSLRGSWSYLLSSNGSRLIGREVSEALATTQSPWIPRVGWLITAAGKLQLGEQTVLSILWVIFLVAALFLIAGLLCRSAAILCWLLHLCVTKSGGLVSYGVDDFMTIGLFYLMLAPLPDRWALDVRILKRQRSNLVYLSFFRSVLQIHLCFIYFFGGLAKALGSGWWDGTNLWRALTRPPFDILSPDFIASWKMLLPILGISVWVIEIAYPVLIWPARTRLLWLVLICAMHFGIGYAMGMPLFAFVMIILNVAAFGPAPASEKRLDIRERSQPLPAAV